jgi:hypothetical protein
MFNDAQIIKNINKSILTIILHLYIEIERLSPSYKSHSNVISVILLLKLRRD